MAKQHSLEAMKTMIISPETMKKTMILSSETVKKTMILSAETISKTMIFSSETTKKTMMTLSLDHSQTCPDDHPSSPSAAQDPQE